MQQAIIGVLGSGLLGGVVKHLIPSDRVNKFIPLINTIAASAYYFSQGVDPFEAILSGAIASMAANGTHNQIAVEGSLKNVRVKSWYSGESKGL